MSDDKVQYKMQLPVELHSRLAEVAKASGRSLSSEIIFRLDESLTRTYIGAGDISDNASLLQQLANERKSTATVLGLLSTTLANILLTAIRLFTPEQRKKLVQIGVWEAIAEGVVNGRGTAIAEMLEGMKSTDAADSLDASAESSKPIK